MTMVLACPMRGEWFTCPAASPPRSRLACLVLGLLLVVVAGLRGIPRGLIALALVVLALSRGVAGADPSRTCARGVLDRGGASSSSVPSATSSSTGS